MAEFGQNKDLIIMKKNLTKKKKEVIIKIKEKLSTMTN